MINIIDEKRAAIPVIVPSELTSDTILHTYLQEAGRYRTLTPEEERELFCRMKDGDKDAREMIINANLRLVVYWVNELKKNSDNSNVDTIDLIQFGNIGLMHAVDKFDVSKGVKFSTYAGYWIKMSILRGKYSTGPIISIPAYIQNDAIRLFKAESELCSKLGRKPEPEELAAATGFSKEKTDKLKSIQFSVTSLNTPIGDDENCDAELMDFIPAGKEWDTEYVSERNFLHENIVKAVRELPERMQTVITMRFGLDGRDRKTLEEVGRALGITRERARQIENEAIRMLSRSKDLLDYAS